MIGRRRRVLANLQSRVRRNGAERGIRGARTWKSEVMVAGREGEKSRTGVGAGMVCWRRRTNRAHSAVPGSTLIGQDKIIPRGDPPTSPPVHPAGRVHPRAVEEVQTAAQSGRSDFARPPCTILDHLFLLLNPRSNKPALKHFTRPRPHPCRTTRKSSGL